MKENLMKLDGVDNLNIAHHYPGGSSDFYTQDLEDMNVKDAQEWLDNGELVAIVSEIHGGIIGYIQRDHADDIATVLNLHVIRRSKK